jgi:hypothetical protein
MRVIGQLAQAVLLPVLVGCLARLLQVAISHNAVQRQDPPVDNRPVWVWDQRGGGVLPGGDVGGDTQISESFSVRFHHRGRPGAMVTDCYYAAANLHDPAAISVDYQTEYLVCADPNDPGATEVWSAYCYCTLQTSGPSPVSRQPPMPPSRPPRVTSSARSRGRAGRPGSQPRREPA